MGILGVQLGLVLSAQVNADFLFHPTHSGRIERGAALGRVLICTEAYRNTLLMHLRQVINASEDSPLYQTVMEGHDQVIDAQLHTCNVLLNQATWILLLDFFTAARADVRLRADRPLAFLMQQMILSCLLSCRLVSLGELSCCVEPSISTPA
jgi:hypothetical protein